MSEEYLGTDIGFDENGDYALLPTGDMITVEGRDCLIEDLQNRLLTPKGDLWHHSEYGFDIYRFIQQENTPINRLDFEQSLQKEVEQDPRVLSCTVLLSSWDMENITAQLTITPIGEGNPINLVFEYNLQTLDGRVL